MKNLNIATNTIRKVKNLLIEPGTRPIKIQLGLARGIVMNLDPAHASQRIYGLYEREIAQVVRQFALAANTLVDVGANDGYYTVALSVLRPEAKILVCEPEPELKQKCLQNLQLNGLSFNERITWLPKFVGSRQDGEFITLDELLKESQEPIFLKIDIDGGELEALKGCTEILKSKTCLLVIETHSQDLEKDCIAYLASLGYQCQIIPNTWWRSLLPELRSIEHNRWFSAKR